jgi:uncharacterized GH25 family protein
MTRRTLAGTALLLLAATAAPAHDYWLEPETFFPAAGQRVAVRLHVGDHFTSEAERPFQKKPTVRFQLLAGKETQDLAAVGEEDRTPLARVTVATAGNALIALERGPATITLAAEKFNRYLAAEGLDAILEQRRKAGEQDIPGRERYRRYLKCLLQAGDRQDETATRVLGQRLEIVPRVNPYTLRRGDALEVRVLFDGNPLAGAKLFAHCREGEKVMTQAVTTSDAGVATFKLDRSGPWLVRLVHMRRCTGDTDIDWESFWGACTFAVR